MAEDSWFDYQEWETQDLANQAQQATIDKTRAEAQDANARRRLAERALAAQLDLEHVLRNAPLLRKGMAKDPAGAMADIAGLMLERGMVENAAELLAKSAVARKDTAAAEKAEFATMRQQAAHLSAALEGVKDERGWQAALMGYISAFPDEFEDVQQLIGYNPNDPDGPGLSYEEMAKQVREAAVTEADKALTMMREAETERAREGANESRLRQKILIPAQAESYRASAEAKRKAAGRSLRSTTITDAEKTIAEEYPQIPPERVRVMAVELSERAETKLRAVPAMGRTQALRQAYAEMKEEQKFAGYSPRVPRAGESIRNPAEMPESFLNGKGTQDLRSGKIYRGVGAWAGSFFVWDGDSGEFVRITEDPLNYEAEPSYEESDEGDYSEEEY